MDQEIKHNDNKFFVELDGAEANITYEISQENIIDFQHTFVPEKDRGKGVAEKIAETALNYARKERLKVIATCRFVSSYLKRHKEYQDLLY